MGALRWLKHRVWFRISRTWGEVFALDQLLRRRVRQCYWKQWKTVAMRRRMLLHLGASPVSVHLAAADRRGCWGAVTNGIVQLALSNQWLPAARAPTRPAPRALLRLDASGRQATSDAD